MKVKCGCPTYQSINSYVSVSSSGSMTERIFYEYIKKVIVPLYPKCKKGKLVRDENGNILHHPVIIKVDTGPGRLGASLENIEKGKSYGS